MNAMGGFRIFSFDCFLGFFLTQRPTYATDKNHFNNIPKGSPMELSYAQVVLSMSMNKSFKDVPKK